MKPLTPFSFSLLVALLGAPAFAQDPIQDLSEDLPEDLPQDAEEAEEALEGYFFDETGEEAATTLSDEDIPSLEDGYGYDRDSPFDDRFTRPSSDDDMPVYGDGWKIWRRDGVLPAGLPRTSIVDVGRFDLNLRYSQTKWDGMRDSRDDISSQDQFNEGYTVAGTELEESRVELDVMYGLDERWTLFATVPFIDRELSYDLAGGGSGTSDASGLGDVIVGGRYAARANEREMLHYSLGLGIPTGEYDERGDYAGQSDAYLPFALQLGTGTFDLYPGVNFVRMLDTWTWGARGEGRIHVDKNSDDWAVSDSLRADLWGSKAISGILSGNARLQANWWGDYHGDAAELDLTRSTLEDESRQGGSLVQVVVGLAADFSNSYAGANRLGIEVGFPIDEWLDGPGLSRETTLRLSWRVGL